MEIMRANGYRIIVDDADLLTFQEAGAEGTEYSELLDRMHIRVNQAIAEGRLAEYTFITERRVERTGGWKNLRWIYGRNITKIRA